MMKKPGTDSLLYYWSDPCRSDEADNPLTALLAEPLDNFQEYREGSFHDMPEIRSESQDTQDASRADLITSEG